MQLEAQALNSLANQGTKAVAWRPLGLEEVPPLWGVVCNAFIFRQHGWGRNLGGRGSPSTSKLTAQFLIRWLHWRSPIQTSWLPLDFKSSSLSHSDGTFGSLWWCKNDPDVTLLVNSMIANPHISDIKVDWSIKSNKKKIHDNDLSHFFHSECPDWLSVTLSTHRPSSSCRHALLQTVDSGVCETFLPFGRGWRK